MAGRPKKNTVDYFPHYVNHGKTMQILSTKHGNNGKAFWWTLLEILSITENHYYDCNNTFNREFLLSKSLLDDISATEILNTLAGLEAIDKELWTIKVIWCQKFVDNIENVYRKRGTEIPKRPAFLLQKYEQIKIPVTKNIQSKVKNIKEEKTKEEKYIALFEKFWKSYPKKVNKQKAKKAFIKDITEDKSTDPDEITDVLIGVLNKQITKGMIDLRENKKYCPHASTWLNEKRYLNEE